MVPDPPVVVLLVAEALDQSSSVRGALEGAGFGIVDAVTSDSIPSDPQPDVVLLTSTVSNKASICRALKSDPGTAPVPLLVMSDDPAEKEDCLKAGADDWLGSQTDGDDLATKVRIWTRLYRAERQLQLSTEVVLQQAEALSQRETRYKALFERIDEGFAVLEVIFDESQRAVDARYVEVNPSFEKQSGLKDVVGKRVRELIPDIEPNWLGTWGDVVLTGRPIRFQRFNSTLQRWFDVYVFRAGRPEERTVASLFRDITERKEANDELRETRNELQSTLDSISDGLLVMDREWRTTYFSRKAAEIIGVSSEQLLGRVIWDLFPHARESKFHEEYHRAVATGEPRHFEEFYPEPLNQWLECHAYPREDGLTVYFHDVTGRHRAEKALRESEERFRTLADNMSQLAWMTDATGWIFWYNQRWYDFTGTTLEEMQGWGWQKVHHPDYVRRVVEKISHSFQSGEPWEDTFPLRGKDGQYRWFLSRALPIRDGSGKIVRWFGTNTDITELRTTQEALRASEDRFRATFEQAAVGLAHVGLDGRWLRVNRRFCEIVGYDHDELRGRTFQEITHPDDLAEDVANAERLLKGEISTYSMEKRYLRKEGSIVWVNLTGSLVQENGEPSYFIAVAEDITERKRVEVERDRLAGQRQLALDAAGMGWWHYDPATRTAHWDERFNRMFHLSGSQGQNGELISRVHPDDLPRIMAAVEAALNPDNPTPFSCEYRIVLEDGSLRWIEAHGIATFETELGVRKGTSLVGTVRDITERREAEEQLRRAREKEHFLSSAVQNSSQPFAASHLDGIFITFNDAYAELTGYSADELRTMSWFDLTAEEWREAEAKVIEELHRTGEPQLYEKEYVTKEGGRIPLELTIHLGRDHSGAGSYYYSFLTDLTQRRLTQETLIRSEKLASVGRMAATIAHEINNPLESMVNLLYLISYDQGLSEKSRAQLRMLEEELERVSHLTKQTLAFYRDSRKFGEVNLPAIVEKVVNVYRSRAQIRNIHIETDLRCDCSVWGSAGELTQIVSNLLANAIDAVSPGGTIFLRLRSSRRGLGEMARITIADNGVGIQSNNLKRIFEPFFTTKDDIGTGLGLWVTRDLLSKHQGTIRVRSQEDRGTVFSVVLPCHTRTAVVVPAPPTELAS